MRLVAPRCRPWPAGPWVLVLAALCGCRLTGAAVWNLGQIHNLDGSHRRVGAVMSSPEYFFRFQLMSLALNSEKYRLPGLEELDDPASASLDNVNVLSEGDPRDPWVRRAQAEWFAFLAVDSPWVLVRERCVEELGELAPELGLATAPEPPGGAEATVDEVRDALLGLVRANGAVLRGEGPPAALAEACARLGGRALSRRGTLSALRGVAPLEDAADRDDPAFAPLLELSLDLQRRVVRLSLQQALLDRSPLVTARAIRANADAFGSPALTPVLVTAMQQQDIVVRLLVALLESIEAHGLPDVVARADGQPFDETQRLGFRLRCVDFLVDTGVRHPASEVRYAALCALRAVEPPDFGPREEEWQAWWQQERPRRAAQLDGRTAPPPPQPATTEPGP